ncbi:MAG: branched-chain amino acid ABC transporter permease [Syntrophales bacterium]|nr:branched-chain amino acid ABC transporter permease [Syntrophales bacterium]MDY0044114.1 branched-chain amino acid ABC transporter permease [Syntrophales bacterium]
METFIQLVINGCLNGTTYALMALGLSIIFGTLGLINFAHGDFIMLAMYGSIFISLFLRVDPYVSSIILVPLFFLFGIVVYKGLFKRLLDAPEESQIIATFGLSFVFQFGAMLAFSTDYKSISTSYSAEVLHIWGQYIDYPHIFSSIVALILIIILFLFLYYTRIGRAIRAVSEQRKGAMMIGINVHRIYAIAAGVGLCCVAVSGIALSTYESVHPTIGIHLNLLCWVIVVLGGIGSLIGTIVGAVVIAMMEVMVGYYFETTLTTFAYFAIFLVILMVRPNGIFGIKERKA